MEKIIDLKKFWQDKSVLITGHTGFKGIWFSVFLNLLGAKVYGYALKAKKKSLFRLINTKKIYKKSFIGDIKNFKKLEKAIHYSKPQVIFHFAAQSLVPYSYQNPKETFETNIFGVLNLLNILKKNVNTKSVVIITTDKVYKDKKRRIYKENDELGGNDPYSASKVCKEIIVNSYVESFYNNTYLRNRISIARSGNVIGSGDYSKNRLIPDILSAVKNNKKLLIRNPNHIRPWQHVIEPLYGYLLLAESQYYGKAKSKLISWNFGPNKKSFIKVKKILDIFKKITKYKLKIKYYSSKKIKETNVLRLSNSKSKKFLKWIPKWDIMESLKKTIELEEVIKKKNVNSLIENQIIEYLEKKKK